MRQGGDGRSGVNSFVGHLQVQKGRRAASRERTDAGGMGNGRNEMGTEDVRSRREVPTRQPPGLLPAHPCPGNDLPG